MDTVQTAASARYYATIVREKSVLRSLIHAGTEITQLGYEGEEDVAGRARSLRAARLHDRRARGVTEFMPVSRLMKDAFDHIDRLFHMRGDRTGLTSGFRDIDAMTTGFQPGNFVIIAARPGMGKTSFALNMAVAAAREEGEPIAFFSLEMSNSELIQRLICSEARISMNDMRRGNIKPHQWEEISRAMGTLNDLADLSRRRRRADRERRPQPLPPAKIDRRPRRDLHRLPAAPSARRVTRETPIATKSFRRSAAR